MEELEQNHNDVIETLINTFGDILTRDVFTAIVESCGGDLEQSANAVMSIAMDVNCISSYSTEEGVIINLNKNNNDSSNNVQINQSNSTQQYAQSVQNSTVQDNIPTNSQSVISYAVSSQNTEPSLQQISKPTMSTSNISQNYWTTQLRQILAHHENGARTLIIMRGVPGSGKSFLAKKILDAMLGSNLEQNRHIHILSADDFFMHKGVYVYNRYRIADAHDWNRSRATQAMRQGISPVIIDNTNVEFFEMEGYVREGVKNGYIIEVVEPNTPWAKKANQLVKRNSHNVPIHTIRRMLENYANGITGAVLMQKFNCYYSHQMQPPVLRNLPLFTQKRLEVSCSTENERQCQNIEVNTIKVIPSTEHEMSQTAALKADVNKEWPSNANKKESSVNCKKLDSSDVEETESEAEKTNKSDKFSEVRKCLEEMEKVEIEWDRGEDWEEAAKNSTSKDESKNFPLLKSDSKPQRRNKSPRSTEAEKLIPSIENCQDWSQISCFLPSWGESSSVAATEQASSILEKRSIGTCIEVGDLSISDFNSTHKIMTSTPRNINEFYIPLKSNKIPEKWLLDKSTSTSNNEILTDNHRCQYEEQHFEAFRKLFKNVARSDLRDIFDNCCGDVNWAVEIVLDGMENKQLGVVENDDTSDTEIETQNLEVCQCLSAYGILPHNNESSPTRLIDSINKNNISSPSFQLKKIKKESVISEASMELKRQIEENVIIPDSHYSEHFLKIRNNRRWDNGAQENINTENENSDTPITGDYPSTSGIQNSPIDCNVPSTSTANSNELNDEDTCIGLDYTENTVNVNLGSEFIAQLDKLFGRNMEYPKNVNPRINMPMSILNEINALWMESIMHQLEEDAKQTELMIQQDEEFARLLAIKEAELSQAGVEPTVPDFKEIMDMDFALSLYHKDIAECLNSKPLDLAAKLSREKLYNLFPDISQSVLSELLAAHEENFQSTVEVLLMSTGKADILDTKNGINKFVMGKELERQKEKLDQEEKKTLYEVEWPLLPKWEKVEMYHVNHYREEAEKHLQERNAMYQKAQEYMRRGMTQVASYCSGIAAYHKRQYEHANSLAAATLMQVHASNNTDNSTIDLHFLRVGEARESLDIFIDTHIQKLKEVQATNTVKYHTLFFITGRGLHSNGRPRVKPAVKKRLRERGLSFCERNPGLLTAKVSANDKLSYQVA